MPPHSNLARSLRAFAGMGLALGALATCTGPTEPPPAPPLLAPSDTLTLDFASSRTVEVQPIAGRGQRLVVELGVSQPSDSLSARLRRNGVTVDSILVRGDAAWSSQQSLWIPRAQSDTTLLLELRWIRRAGTPSVSAFIVFPTPDPEHAEQIVSVGDTVVEYLDGDTDIDWFRISGAPNSRVTVWMQLDSASQPIRIQMGSDPVGAAARISALTDSAERPLAMVRDLEATPETWLVVRAAPGTVGSPAPLSARYRLWVEGIDPAPETAAATAVSGDTIVERIDAFGDIDRFVIPEAQGEEIRVFLARDSLSDSPVRARLILNDGESIPFTLDAADSVLDIKRSPWVQKSNGEPAIVEVLGDTGAAADLRPVGYRVMYQRRERAPETAPVSLGLVDSVVTETLASCADADDFEITGPPLTYVSIGAVLHDAPGCRVRARLLVGEGELGAVDSLLLGTDPDVDRWAPLPIQASGVLRLRIEGIDAPGQPIGRVQDVGYTLDVYAVDSTPELSPREIALGDSLLTETIDRCSDVDVFDIVGPPGSVVVVGAGFGRATTCGMALSSENNGSGVFHAGANVDAMRFGHLTIPASGRVPLRVATERGGRTADRGAPYVLKVDAVDPAPELVPSALVLGDTVHETFSRCGDIDRWQVPLVEGEGVWLRFDRARSSSCMVVASLRYESYQSAEFVLYPADSTRQVLLHYQPPVTATYTLSVHTLPIGHTDDRDLPYSLVVTGAQNEVAPSALAVGDTSAVEPWHDHDLDLFVVPLQAGRQYVASTLGPVKFTLGAFGVSFDDHPRGFRYPFTATETRDHRFRMGIVGSDHPDPVNFRFMVHEFDPAPESLPDTLVAGDTTDVESFGHPGDEDHFTAGLTPGRYFRLEAFLSAGTGGTLSTGITALGGDSVIAYAYSPGDWSTARAGVPASGRIVAPMRHFLTTTDTTTNPSYRLRLVEIDPAPESRAATLAPGDSITDEPLDDPWDLDEYQLTVATSGTYIVRLRAAATACAAGDDRVRLSVRHAATEVASILSRTDDSTAGTVVLTAGTTYTLRVEAVDAALGDCVMRTYRASLAPQP